MRENYYDISPAGVDTEVVAHPATSAYLMAWEDIRKIYSVYCHDDTKKAWRANRRVHPRRFICCDNDDPEQKGVLLMYLQWTRDTERSTEELQRVGFEAPLTSERCGTSDQKQIRPRRISMR